MPFMRVQKHVLRNLLRIPGVACLHALLRQPVILTASLHPIL